MSAVALINKALSGDLSGMVEYSFKDFHAKGLDYLCLHRSPNYTVKVYILDGDVSKMPEVVNPHDHRYPFRTTVLKGKMVDHRLKRQERFGRVFDAFDYMTPLNGGDGFTWRGEERLAGAGYTRMGVGGTLMTAPDTLHTIQMEADQTILMLEQYGDVVPSDRPTSTWTLKGNPAPDTSGLYSRFTEGEFADKLEWLKGVVT